MTDQPRPRKTVGERLEIPEQTALGGSSASHSPPLSSQAQAYSLDLTPSDVTRRVEKRLLVRGDAPRAKPDFRRDVPPSAMLGRLQAFLPQMKQANAELAGQPEEEVQMEQPRWGAPRAQPHAGMRPGGALPPHH